ncbi:hypothetical protein GMORB2_5023 [Geosmithia morbida]|uniref:Uncharacterized protein n=1 Tax=Geosmithia morbida TaxID=1094350 RepID=A0A9P4YYY3_9HYPO|nr:uncharacterized protein GMORB2_5023 [Geosmithia morbida]KAF4124357.1 hypothetical protein GMORB2_5023 [Geosmithia morbida]
MADGSQPLIAAFSFGIVAIAAGANGGFLLFKHHDLPISQDGSRLALLIFLFSATLWAILDFAALQATTAVACQVTVVFESIFDQLARVALIQALVWSLVGLGTPAEEKSLKALILPQVVLALRFILGAVFVGFQTSQTSPVCVSSTSQVTLGIAVIVVDILLALFFLERFLVNYRVASKQNQNQSNLLLLPIVGLGVWTALSAPMLLGMQSLAVVLRTALPAIGVLILVVILALCRKPFEPAPRDAKPETATIPRDWVPREYRMSGFASPRQQQMGNFVDVTQGQTVSRSAIAKSLPAKRDADSRSTTSARSSRSKRKANKFKKGGSQRPIISGPILREDLSTSIGRIPIVKLETARENDRKEREMRSKRLNHIAASASASIPEGSSERTLMAGSRQAPPADITAGRNLASRFSTAATSGAQLSPAMENVRQRSPRNSPQVQGRDHQIVFSPLRTDLSINNVIVSSIEKPERLARPDTWELFGIRNPDVDMKVPVTDGPATRYDYSAMRSRGGSPGSHGRSSSSSRRKDTRHADAMFIDPSTPPPIPEGLSKQRRGIVPPFQASNDTRFVFPKPRAPQSPNSRSYLDPITPNSIASNKPVKESPTLPAGDERRLSVVPPMKPVVYKHRYNNTVPAVPMKNLPPISPGFEAILRESVIHRPRPIPRTPETAFLGHSHVPSQKDLATSVSYESLRAKRMLLQKTAPGSPSNLPPLPPMPQLSDSRPRPNDTVSMTFSEKMDLLVADVMSVASSSSRATRRRSSSVPDAPLWAAQRGKPAGPMSAVNSSLIDDMDYLTNRSTMTSVQTRSILGLADPGDESRPQPAPRPESGVSGGGTATEQEPGPPLTEPSLPETSMIKPWEPEEVTQEAPRGRAAAPPADDDYASISSAYSPEPMPSASDPCSAEQPPAWSPDDDLDSDDETLNTSVASTPLHDSPAQLSSKPRVNREEGKPSEGGWQFRMAQEPSTFSARNRSPGSRRGPPPRPLSLNQPSRLIVVEAEPSPLESPTHALDVLEIQLHQMERNSTVASPLDDSQRMNLLADLEQEIGVQESHWNKIRKTIFSRDSISTVAASPQGPRVQENSSFSKRWAELAKLNDHRSLSPLPPSTNRDRASLIRDELSYGNIGSARNSTVSRLSASGSLMSFLTVSRPVTMVQGGGSPTPPDSEGSEVEDTAMPAIHGDLPILQPTVYEPPLLWHVEAPSPVAPMDEPQLWSLRGKPSSVLPEDLSDLPAPKASVKRPAPEGLKISSSQLWCDERPRKRFTSWKGLWRSTCFRPKSAQRPTRKSKRITMLPDIPESPKPLPGKKGELGIFEFPWGERSGTGIYVPPVTAGLGLGVMPGTMMTGGSILRPLNPVPTMPVTDASALSFFENFDDEDDGDNFSDFDMSEEVYGEADEEDYGEGEDEDDSDDFDEDTIWEIASLLKRDATAVGECTSRRTSSVCSSPTTIGSYESTSFDNEGNPRDSDIIPRGAVVYSDEEGDFGAAEKPETWPLWEPRYDAPPPAGKGLPQPDDVNWSMYLGTADAPRRRQRAPVSSPPPPIPAGKEVSLWSAAPAPPAANQSLLWEKLEVLSRKYEEEKKAPNSRAGPLWNAAHDEIQEVRGLPQPEKIIWESYLSAAAPVLARRVPKTHFLASLSPVGRSGKPHLWTATSLPALPRPSLLTQSATKPGASMWEAGNFQVQVAGKGLPQPNEATWELYLSTAPAAPNTRHISETPLRAPPPSPKASLWQAGRDAVQKVKGLPQPNEETWELYLYISSLTPFSKRASSRLRTLEPLSIDSQTSLWTAPHRSAPRQYLARQTPRKPQANMWQAGRVAVKESKGLPQPSRTTWSLYLTTAPPASAHVPKKSGALEPLSFTDSPTSLWVAAPRGLSRQSLLWERARETLQEAEPDAACSKPLATLWEATHDVVEAKGLQQPNEATWSLYLSTASPFVKCGSRRPEALELPPFADKSSLWAPSQSLPTQSLLLWSQKAEEPGKQAEEVTSAVIKPGASLWQAALGLVQEAKGLVQPNEATWNLYLATAPATSAKRSPNRAKTPEPRAVDVKSSLWAPTTPTTMSLPKLWEAPWASAKRQLGSDSSLWQAAAATQSSYGLEQPNEATWGLYLSTAPAATSAERPSLRALEPLAIDSKSSLWTATLPLARSASKLWGLSSTSETQPSLSKLDSSLWKEDSVAANFRGLPQPDEATWGLKSSLWAAPAAARASASKLWALPSSSVDPQPAPISGLWQEGNATVPSYGLAPLDEATWGLYLSTAPATHVASIKQSPKTPDPVSFDAKSGLWTAPAAVSSSASKLWELPCSSVEALSQPEPRANLWQKEHAAIRSHGLAQPDEATWGSYLSAAAGVPAGRASERQVRAELPSIDSTSLWTASVSAPVVAPAPPSGKSPLPSSSPAKFGLWQEDCAISTSHGLAQPNEATWSLYLATAPSTSPKRALRTLEPLPLDSESSLWAAPVPVAASDSRLWALPSSSSECTASPVKPQPGPASNLWREDRAVTPSHGLAQPDDTTWDSYLFTTSGVPTRRPPKRQPSSLELPSVDSTGLWDAISASPLGQPEQIPLPSSPTTSTLWKRKHHRSSSSHGLPQPDTTTWTSYLEDGEATASATVHTPSRSRSSSAASSLAPLSLSNSRSNANGRLWTYSGPYNPPQTPSRRPLLWRHSYTFLMKL